MELATLNECAYALLDGLKQKLISHGAVEPVIRLFHEDRVDHVRFDPALLRPPDTRSALFGAVRRIAAAAGAHGVLIGMDAYCLVPDVDRMLQADPEVLRQTAAGGIDAAVAAGFGRKSEAVVVILQTPIYSLLLEQLYRREDGGVVIGELRTIDSSTPSVETVGRLQMFRPPAGTVA